MSVTLLPCPACQSVTEPVMVEGEEVWRCTAPGSTRRTYGTDDFNLPSYSETDSDGTVVCFHGTGEVDIEATAELAAQDGPGENDDAGSCPAPAAAVWEPEARESYPPEGWRHFTEATYDPAYATTVTITYSDGSVEREWPWPQALLVEAEPHTVPTATRPGPARLVRR